MFAVTPLFSLALSKKYTLLSIASVVMSMALCQFIFGVMQQDQYILAILGLAMWGIQRAGAQIVFSSTIFNNIDKQHYGTSIGLFYIITGFAVFIASMSAGHLNQIDMKLSFIYGNLIMLFLSIISIFLIQNNKNQGVIC